MKWGYESIHFMVPTDPTFKVRARSGTLGISERMKQCIGPGKKHEREYENLLPTVSSDWQTLTEWHVARPEPGRIIEVFGASVRELCGQDLAATDLGKALATIVSLANSRKRVLVRVDDFSCVVPWEVLICAECRDPAVCPIVFRWASVSSPCPCSRSIAHIGSFEEIEPPADLPSRRTHVVELAHWAIRKEGKPNWVELMEHPEAQEIEGVGEVRQIPATLSKKEILTMICDTTGIDIQYLFTRAGSERKAAIAPYRKLSCQDLHTHPAKSAASIFGIFPVVWGRPNRRTPQWAPFALAAHSFCATPLLGLTTLFPMQAHEAASVAAHLTSAALAESEESGAAQATKVAERLVEWLCGADHPSAPEFLVLAGHLGIPITPPPLPTGAETAKAIRERVGAGDLQGAIELTCLLYTSPSPRDRTRSRMPSSA